jgi:hypothetical protein
MSKVQNTKSKNQTKVSQSSWHSSMWHSIALGNSKAKTFKSFSSSSSNLSASSYSTHGSSSQFLMSKINKYKLFAPRQHQRRLCENPCNKRKHVLSQSNYQVCPILLLQKKQLLGIAPHA